MNEYIFFATFGSGQAGYPGYLRVSVEADNIDAAELIARKRVNDATAGKWCGMYRSLDELHPGDKLFRGEA